jgi:hypothetical protein
VRAGLCASSGGHGTINLLLSLVNRGRCGARVQPVEQLDLETRVPICPALDAQAAVFFRAADARPSN